VGSSGIAARGNQREAWVAGEHSHETVQDDGIIFHNNNADGGIHGGATIGCGNGHLCTSIDLHFSIG
jgi:chorismate synthase